MRISASEQGTGAFHNARTLSEILTQSSKTAAALKTTENLQEKEANDSSYSLTVVQSSAGSMSSMRDLIEGRAEFGIVNANLANAMFTNPKKWGVDQVIDRVRLVTRMQPSVLHVLVKATGDKPPTLASLEGARVSVGLPSAMTSYSIGKLFEQNGTSLKKMDIQYLPLKMGLRDLHDQKLDAIVMLDHTPSPIVESLLASGEYTLVSLDRQSMPASEEALAAGCTLISGALYPGLPENFLTVSIDNYLLVQNNVSPSTVAPILKLLGAEQDDIESPIPLHDAHGLVTSTLNPSVLDGSTTTTLTKQALE